MANKDVLKISFDASAGIKELEQNLLGSMDQISDEVSEKLEKAFEKAGRNPKLKKQLTGVYQGLFDDLADASGDLDKVNKAIDRFAGKIEYINTVTNKTKIKGIFDNLSIENVDKVLKGYDKIIEKEEKIAKLSSNEYKNGIREKTTVKSLKALENTYQATEEAKAKYENRFTDFVRNAGIETSAISKEIKEYSNLIALFEKINSTKVNNGSEDAVKKSQALLFTMQKIEELENGNTLFSNFRKNELKDVKDITSSIKTLTLNGVEGSITNFVSKIAKPLKDEITNIYADVVKDLLKMSKHQAISDAKTQVKVESVIGAGEKVSGNGTGTSSGSGVGNEDVDGLKQKYDEHNNIFAKYFDTANKSAEELEDTFYDIGDRLDDLNQKSMDGDLVGKELKEYITLYKQLEDLTTKIDGFSIPKQYTELFDELVQYNEELSEYANKLDNIKNQGYIQEGNNDNIEKSNVDDIKKGLQEAKENISTISATEQQVEKTTDAIEDLKQAEKDLLKQDTPVKIDIDVQEALVNIDTIQEKLDKLPETKSIKVNIVDNDYSNTPLLSDDAGETITAFRGVKDAWSGLINDKGISFFTDKLALAADYADSLAENGKVYAANLSFKNPLEINGNGALWDKIEYDGIKRTTDEIIEIAKQLGHDGVIFRNIRDGFSDTDEDISNVMVALNKAQIKNEQVVGSVKAGTGEMTKILNSESNSNVNIESQQKLQNELEQTEQQAKEIDAILSGINQNSILSSDTLEHVGQLKQKVDEVISSVDAKTRAFQEEEQAVESVVANESLKLETLKQNLLEIVNVLEKIKLTPINIDLNLLDGENIDSNFTTLLSELGDKVNSLDLELLSQLAAALKEIKIEDKSVDNLELITIAFSDFKDSLNGIPADGKEFLELINSITSRTDELKDLANVLSYTAKKINEVGEITQNRENKSDKSSKNKKHKIDPKKNIAAIQETANIMNKLKMLGEGDVFADLFDKESKKVEEFNKRLNVGTLGLTEYKNKIKEIQTNLKSNLNIVDFLEPNDINAAMAKIDEYADDISEGKAEYKGSKPRIDKKTLKQFTDVTYQWEDQNKKVHTLVMSYEKLSGALSEVHREQAKTEKQTRSLSERIKQGWLNVAQYAASFLSFYEVLNFLKQGISVVRELDSALTEMRKVSDETVSSLKNFQKVSFDIADTVGTTAQQIQNSTADFMRLGESLEQAAESAQVANILLNVSEFENIDEATESLVSMAAAYDELDKIDIVDKLNIIGNNFAISTDGLATALQESASALTTAGNDMDEAVALATAANSVVQDPDKVGAGLRTIALRITGTEAAKKELEELGESVDDFTVTTASKLNEKVMMLTKTTKEAGVSLLDMNGNYRSTYEIISDIADRWEDIKAEDLKTGENRQNALLEMLAGKNRSNILASMLESPDILKEAYATSLNDSEGSAEKELEKYLESIEGRIAKFQNRLQEFWYNLLDSEMVKEFVDMGTQLIDVLDNVLSGLTNSVAFDAVTGILSTIVDFLDLITSGLGEISTWITAIGGIKLWNNFKGKDSGGRVKMFTLENNMPPNRLAKRCASSGVCRNGNICFL